MTQVICVCRLRCFITPQRTGPLELLAQGGEAQTAPKCTLSAPYPRRHHRELGSGDRRAHVARRAATGPLPLSDTIRTRHGLGHRPGHRRGQRPATPWEETRPLTLTRRILMPMKNTERREASCLTQSNDPHG